MAYGIGEGIMQGIAAGTAIRQRQEELDEYKKNAKLKRDELELEIERKRGEAEKALSNRTADELFLRRNKAILEGASNGTLRPGEEFPLPSYEDVLAELRPKPKAPEPEKPRGVMGVLATIRNSIAPEQPDPAAAPAAGIQSPAPEQQPQQKPPRNPYIPAGVKDPDVMAERFRLQGQVLTEHYIRKGEIEKANKVPSEMRKLMQQGWEETAGETLLALQAGNREVGLAGLKGLYKLIPDGFDLNENSGVFDKDTKSWKGVELIDQKTGAVKPMDITREQIFAWANRYGDIGSAAKTIIDMGSNEREYGLRVRAANVAERNAKTNEGTLEVNKTRAGTEAAREARRAADDGKARDELVASKIAEKAFPRANTSGPTYKDQMEFPGTEEQWKLRAKEIERQTRVDTEGLDLFSQFVGSVKNQKVPRNTLADLSRAIATGRADEVKQGVDPDGSKWVMWKGAKVYR